VKTVEKAIVESVNDPALGATELIRLPKQFSPIE
jgi:hypothetical protein